MSEHTIFVLGVDGKPLMPTTPCRAKKLLKAGKATKEWSKFGTFGIRMTEPTRTETQPCAMGIDHGTRFEGYSVICGDENSLNVKLDLPDKKKIVAKLEEKRILRRERRGRKCRRREARFNNRKRKPNWLAPSQDVIVQSRLKVIRELARIYPITKAGLENVCFNHLSPRKKMGAMFSTVEIGKQTIRKAFSDLLITLHEYKGWETKETRERYGWKKVSDKSADKFEAHCSDSLSLACLVQNDEPVAVGPMIVVDDTYRCVRRKLFDTQYSKGGIKQSYSRGTVLGLRKGLQVGYKGVCKTLTGIYNGKFRLSGKERPVATKLDWISSNFCMRLCCKEGAGAPSLGQA